MKKAPSSCNHFRRFRFVIAELYHSGFVSQVFSGTQDWPDLLQLLHLSERQVKNVVTHFYSNGVWGLASHLVSGGAASEHFAYHAKVVTVQWTGEKYIKCFPKKHACTPGGRYEFKLALLVYVQPQGEQCEIFITLID